MLNSLWSGGLAPLHTGLSPLGGLRVIVQDAEQQRRTPRYRTDIWIRPGRVPSKRAGRKGTRRAWKRRHPPHWLWAYEEPKDVLRFADTIIATPRQHDFIKRAAKC